MGETGAILNLFQIERCPRELVILQATLGM